MRRQSGRTMLATRSATLPLVMSDFSAGSVEKRKIMSMTPSTSMVVSALPQALCKPLPRIFDPLSPAGACFPEKYTLNQRF